MRHSLPYECSSELGHVFSSRNPDEPVSMDAVDVSGDSDCWEKTKHPKLQPFIARGFDAKDTGTRNEW
jgi:hypothetical protein